MHRRELRDLIGWRRAAPALMAIGVWLLCGTAAYADADPAAIQMLPNDDSGSAQCGPDSLTWDNTRSYDFQTPGSVTLTVTAADGTQIVDLSRPLAAGEKLGMLWCGDILGDGSQALAVQAFSGGAHCCFSPSVILLAPGAAHLLDADLGNGALSQPRQLDGGGSLELPASSDVFAYFDDLSFAASPFMPLIYAFDGTEYTEATRQFPDVLRADVARADKDLADAVARPPSPGVPADLADQEQESVALRLYGLHVLLGDADRALPALQRRLSPAVAAWLGANAQAAAAAMAQRYDLGNTPPP